MLDLIRVTADEQRAQRIALAVFQLKGGTGFHPGELDVVTERNSMQFAAGRITREEQVFVREHWLLAGSYHGGRRANAQDDIFDS